MEQVAAHDFTGGVAARLAATDFSDRQWAELYGVVLESDAELRTQWPWVKLGTGTDFEHIFHGDDFLVGITPTSGSIYTIDIPPTGEVVSLPVWTDTGENRSDAKPVGLVPIPRTAGQGFATAALFNSIDMAGTALGVYGKAGIPSPVFEYTERYPNSTADAAAMPRANVATMWGDRLVLGDIEWIEDEDDPFSASNAIRYPNGLWLSQPGQPDRWDLLDTVLTGVKDGQGSPRVVDLQPTEQGLMILTTAGMYLLRGTPSSFDYEEIRPGMNPSVNATAGWWPGAGAAVWVSSVGWVWVSDGRGFYRIDEPLGLDMFSDPAGFAAGWDDFLLVGVGARMFAFRRFGDGGAWTELVTPGQLTSVFQLGAALYGLVDGVPWRMDRESPTRGHVDGVLHEVRVSSRTFEGGDGHRVSFWRAFGLRAEPLSDDAALTSVTLYDGPVLSAQSNSLAVTLDASTGTLAGRDELMVLGHGPSLEASVKYTFEGDVSVEQVTAWFNQARGSR